MGVVPRSVTSGVLRRLDRLIEDVVTLGEQVASAAEGELADRLGEQLPLVLHRLEHARRDVAHLLEREL